MPSDLKHVATKWCPAWLLGEPVDNAKQTNLYFTSRLGLDVFVSMTTIPT